MKKLLLVFAVTAVSVISANAQSKKDDGGFTFGAGINAALPVGSFGDGWSFGLGGQIQGEYKFSENFSAVANTGYTSFFGKTIGGTKVPSIGFIPIVAGVRVYPASQFFIGVQAGYGILTGSGTSTSAFDYFPHIGYNGESFQLSVGYNGLSKNGETNGHISLTGIYKFGGGK